MGEILRVLVAAFFIIMSAAFLFTGTLFFMEMTLLASELRTTIKSFGRLGAIAIPMGGSGNKPITGSNSTPV